MTTSPLHRDEPEGVDSQGRLHGASAVRRLLNATPVGPDWNHGAPVNFWTAAADAVAQADQETKDAALRDLLALHMFGLTATDPTVAVRNVKEGDVVELHGMTSTVTQKLGDGKNGHAVNLHVTSGDRDDDTGRLFAYDVDVRIPLKHRVSAEMGQRLFALIVDHAQHARDDQESRSYRGGLEEAFLLLTDENPERLQEEIQEALQIRHEEQISAEEGFENL